LRDWHARYAAAGLTVVGVHTPEFAWERPHDRVVAAVKELGIRYPVVQDNDLGNWRRWQTWAWPTGILVDRTGVVRASYIGEGAYAEQERLIRALLAERP
jgi:hypothetical protein